MAILTLKTAAVVGGALLTTGRPQVDSADVRAFVAGARFPMHEWRGYLPTRTQEYRAADHHGVDLMYRRKVGGPDSMWPIGLTRMNGTPKSYGDAKGKFFVPDMVCACAVRDGTIWSCMRTDRGIAITLDHGRPFASFYTHLSSVRFPLGSAARGIKVKAGDPLGLVGYDPSGRDRQYLMHLHFEIWYKGNGTAHVDPWPLIERAPLPEVPR
jgi:hypothetical protein